MVFWTSKNPLERPAAKKNRGKKVEGIHFLYQLPCSPLYKTLINVSLNNFRILEMMSTTPMVTRWHQH